MSPESTVDIAPFDGSSKSEIQDLILSIQVGEFGVAITLQDQPDLQNITESYQRGSGNFWVARLGQKVVGTVGLLDIGYHKVALRKMFVHPDFRGKDKGVAQRLMQVVVHWCKQKEVIEILLGTTEKYLAAHRFYEKNSFVQVRLRDLPPYFPRMAVDSRFYSLRFTSSATENLHL